MPATARGRIPTVVEASLFTVSTITTSSNFTLTTAQQGIVRVNPGNSDITIKLPAGLAGFNYQFLIRNIANLSGDTGVLTIETNTGGLISPGGTLQPAMYGNYLVAGTTVSGEFY